MQLTFERWIFIAKCDISALAHTILYIITLAVYWEIVQTEPYWGSSIFLSYCTLSVICHFVILSILWNIPIILLFCSINLCPKGLCVSVLMTDQIIFIFVYLMLPVARFIMVWNCFANLLVVCSFHILHM